MRDGNSGHGVFQVRSIKTNEIKKNGIFNSADHGTSEVKKNGSFKLADHGNSFALDATHEQVGGHETSQHDKRSQVV